MRHPGECLPPGINMTSINMVVIAVWIYSLHTLTGKALAGDMGICVECSPGHLQP